MQSITFPDITVKELHKRYPELIPAFLKMGFLCVGCPAAAFHTINDVAREYGYEKNKLIEELRDMIDRSGSS
jgi:hybrid cluster-associated redox disulfide protein